MCEIKMKINERASTKAQGVIRGQVAVAPNDYLIDKPVALTLILALSKLIHVHSMISRLRTLVDFSAKVTLQ